MEVTRKSQASGITRTLDLNITLQQLLDYEKGMKIQDAFPNLTTAEREFFMTGITEEEWNAMFPDDENDYDSFDDYNSFDDYDSFDEED